MCTKHTHARAHTHDGTIAQTSWATNKNFNTDLLAFAGEQAFSPCVCKPCIDFSSTFAGPSSITSATTGLACLGGATFRACRGRDRCRRALYGNGLVAIVVVVVIALVIVDSGGCGHSAAARCGDRDGNSGAVIGGGGGTGVGVMIAIIVIVAVARAVVVAVGSTGYGIIGGGGGGGGGGCCCCY